jgi:hypothetical protein
MLMSIDNPGPSTPGGWSQAIRAASVRARPMTAAGTSAR